MTRAHEQLQAKAAQLESLSPLAVLGRGYSLTVRQSDGSIVRDPNQLACGETILTHLARGRVISHVDELVAPPQKQEDVLARS